MKKILLVNAAKYLTAEGKSLLDRRDFQVFLATGPGEALKIHREERVNLIVADLTLQEMSGNNLCALIRYETEIRTVSFIQICENSPAELALAETSGANVILKKPFSAETLLEHVEALLSVSTRRGYRVLLRLRVKGAKDESIFFCTSQNLSASGMLIESDRNLAVGDQISCSFFLPEAAHIVADGEVVRVEKMPDNKHRYGVRFSMISPEYQKEIVKFIAANSLLQKA